MAVWIRDGFEFYNTASDMIVGSGYGIWGAVDTTDTSLSTSTRFGFGRSLISTNPGVSFVTSCSRDGFSNAATVFTGVSAYYSSAALGAASNMQCIMLRDGGVNQCCICFGNDGSIQLVSGNPNGTTIATYAGAFLAQQWNQFQFKVVISNTVGEFHVRRNGNTSDDFSATSLNTRGGTSNNQVNGVAIGCRNTSVIFFDDFAAWDTASPSPWNDWVGDFRAIQRMPSGSDVQAQWSQSNGGSTSFGTPGVGNTLSIPANTVQCNFIGDNIPTSGGLLTAGTIYFNAGFTGHAKMAIYSTEGNAAAGSFGAPVTLLGVSNEVTNPGSGANTFTFATPVPILNQHRYAFAILTDTNCVVQAGGSVSCWGQGGVTYASGFPSTFAGGASNINSPKFQGTISTVTNGGLVSDLFEDGVTTYNFSSTVGQEDLYGIEALPFSPSSILGVDVVILSAKSDAGARQLAAELKSGATTQVFATITPNTSFNFNRYQQDTDPNTSLAWTVSAINSAELGLKVIT